MKTIINKIFSAFTSLVMLSVMIIPAISFAETNGDFTECVIPIISNNSESAEWNGLKKDGKLFVSLEDACVLTGSEIVEMSEEGFIVQRNTVKIYGNINNKACLCVSEADYEMFQWNGNELNPLSIGNWIAHASVNQPFDLNIIKNDKGVFVELFPFVFAFGAEISKFSNENIADIDADLTSDILSTYNINFETFDNYYVIDTGIPFDEVFAEYMNSADYRFEWKNCGEKANAGVARFWDVIVDDYNGIFNYAYDSYESDMLYNEALIAILQCKPGNFEEEKTPLESLEKLLSYDPYEAGKNTLDTYNQFCNFVEFTQLDKDNASIEKITAPLKKYVGDNASPLVEKQILSLANTLISYCGYYNKISKFNEIESNILQKGILDDKLEDEYDKQSIVSGANEIPDWLRIISITAGIKAGAAKYQKLLESYRGLYDSAEKLNNQIMDKKKALEDAPEELIKNIQSVVFDLVMNKAATKAVPYLSAVDFVWNTLKVIPGAEVSDASKAEYIQRIAFDRVSLDKSEKSYYSLILAMQSSYYAYSRMLTFEKRMAESEDPDTNDEELRHRIESYKSESEQKIEKYRERCQKLSELITKAYCSDRTFYGNMNSDWESTLAKELTGSLSEEIPDYSVEAEDFPSDIITEQNFTWHIEPTIEAEDIVNSDEDVHNFGDRRNYHYPSDEYSVIKQNGKYGIIKYDGTYYAEAKYEYGGIGYSEIDDLYVYDSNGSNNSFDYDFVYLKEDISKIDSDKKPASHGYISSSYIYCSIDNEIYDVTFEPQLLRELQKDNTSLFIVKQFDYDIKTEIERYNTMCIENVPFRYGISNISELIIPCQYDYGCCNDSGDVYALEINEKWGFFDLEGNQIIDFICEPMSSAINEYDWCPYFDNNSNCPYLATEGYIPVKIDGKCGYYDDKGNEVIPVGTFEEVRPVHNGLAWVKFDGKWGVIQMPAAEPDTETETSIDISGLFETGNWQELYVDELEKYMSSNKYNDEAMFDLYDIDSDGTPELFISEGSSFIDTCNVYTVYNDKLVKENERGVNFNCTHSGNGIDELTLQVSQSTHVFRCGGFGAKTYKKLENGKFTSILEAEERRSGDSYIYTINGKTATAEEYRQSEADYEVYANDFVDVGRKYPLNKEFLDEIFR